MLKRSIIVAQELDVRYSLEEINKDKRGTRNFIVVQVKNTTEFLIGQQLNADSVDRAIANGVEVTIRGTK